MKKLTKTLCTVAMLLGGAYSWAQPAGYTSAIVGDPADVTTTTTGGALLMGGGLDNDDAMRWMLQKAGGGDIVVLRVTGADGYNDYLYNLAPCNSVETIIITSLNGANNATVAQKIRNAEALFIAGGDQNDYVTLWKDTPVEDAINYLINTKGVVVGGTSAGCAIQGRAYFDAANGTIRSEDALANPYNTMLTLQRDNFVNHPILANTITDTHYDNPDRRGRHTTFMARMVADWGVSAKGIGVDEKTAVCIDPNGTARVFGNSASEDYVYFLQVQGGNPEVCQPNTPLTWSHAGQAVKVYKIRGEATGSRTFNLNNWTDGVGGTWEYFYACNGTFLQACTVSGGGGGATYCTSKGQSSAGEWIDAVSLRDLSKTSGNNGGYADFTATVGTSLERGQSYSLYMRPGYSGTKYREYFSAWIDFNQDGDFNDSGELLMSYSGSRSFTKTVSIPTAALTGETRMRVAMSYRAYPTPCETFEYGEVEDYKVSIFGGSGARMASAPIKENQAFEASLFPNPSKGQVFLALPLENEAPIQIAVFNMLGQQVWQAEQRTQGTVALDLSGLGKGQYLMKVSGSGGVWSKRFAVE